MMKYQNKKLIWRLIIMNKNILPAYTSYQVFHNPLSQDFVDEKIENNTSIGISYTEELSRKIINLHDAVCIVFAVLSLFTVIKILIFYIDTVQKKKDIIKHYKTLTFDIIKKEFEDAGFIGQEDFVNKISMAVFTHVQYTLYYLEGKKNKLYNDITSSKNKLKNKTDDDLKKQNILIIGPTGCGKSLCVEIIRNLLDVPYVKANMASMTPAGYINDTVSDEFAELISQPGGEYGILFLDEFDKLTQNIAGQNGFIAGGNSIQRELLVPLTGGYVSSRNKFGLSSKIHKESRSMVIMAGAWSDKPDIKAGVEVDERTLIEYGLISELVGRISSVLFLKAIEKTAFIQFVKNKSPSIRLQTQLLENATKVKVVFTDDAIDELADHAIAIGLGMRIMEKKILNILQFLNIEQFIKKSKNSSNIIIDRALVKKIIGEVPTSKPEKNVTSSENPNISATA